VRQKGLDATRWVVTRGVGDSVAASHLAGATLTAAVQASVSSETLIPPDPFADAGGEQTIRLLGPFHIAFDTAGVASDGPPQGVSLGATIPANSVLLRIHCENPVAWDQDPDNAYLEIIATTVGQPNGWPVARYRIGDSFSTAASHVGGAEAIANSSGNAEVLDSVQRTYAFGASGNSLRAFVDNVTGATQGEVDIYALIAEPVA
jgi:hypothetical protein